jgi:hypothetical protein
VNSSSGWRIAAVTHLAPLLEAHSSVRLQRPRSVWEADVDDAAIVRLLRELIAAARLRGTPLLRVANVVVEEDGDDRAPRAGEYVAVSVVAAGDWGSEIHWRPADPGSSVLVNPALDAAGRAAGAL